MTLSSLLCSDKQLTVDVAVVQNAKTRYDGLVLFDNRSCIALCKALRKAALDVALILGKVMRYWNHSSIDKERPIFPIIKWLSCQGWSSRFRGIKGFFFTKEDALPQIINEMLQLHSPILGHYPLLLGSVWYTAVSWYKVSKQFHIKVKLHVKHTNWKHWPLGVLHESGRWSIFTRLSCQRFRFFVRLSF